MIFHTAVLAYLPDRNDRAAFAETVDGLNAVWIANERPGVVDGHDQVSLPWPSGLDPFLLTRDKRPIAWTDPHGTRIDWLP